MPGKGRATSYTDYYKNNDKGMMPGGGYDDEDDEEPKRPGVSKIVSPLRDSAEAKAKKARKKALQRRLSVIRSRTGKNGTA